MTIVIHGTEGEDRPLSPAAEQRWKREQERVNRVLDEHLRNAVPAPVAKTLAEFHGSEVLPSTTDEDEGADLSARVPSSLG